MSTEQSAERHKEAGNKLYKQQLYEEAAGEYSTAIVGSMLVGLSRVAYESSRQCTEILNQEGHKSPRSLELTTCLFGFSNLGWFSWSP